MRDKNNMSFESTLKLTKIALLLAGVKIYQNPWNIVIGKLTKSLYYINLVCLYSVLMGEMYYIVDGIQHGTSIIELSLISPCFTISIMGTVKILFLYKSKDLIKDIIDHLRRINPDFGNDNDDQFNESSDPGAIMDEQNDIVKKSMIFLNNVILMLTWMSVIVLIMFCLSPLVLMLYDYLLEGECEIVYPYLVKYSFDVHDTPFWYLVYLEQVFSTEVVCVYVYGSDTLFYALCAYIEMHFRLLSSRFERIISSTTGETRDNMIESVRRHQELIYLVKQIEEIYSMPMLFNIITSSLLICLSGFNITVANDVSTVCTYTTFLAMSLAQIFMLCFFGDMLMRSSSEVSGAIYRCAWYEADEATKRTIILVIIRAQKPCKLTAANFADLNLRAFTTILSRSWSYFALLKTVYN